MHRHCDPHAVQFHPVVAVCGNWLGGQAEVVQGGVKGIAGRVAGEDASGAVAAVCGWSQSDDCQRCVRRAEAWHGPGPVIPVPEGPALDAGDLLLQATNRGQARQVLTVLSSSRTESSRGAVAKGKWRACGVGRLPCVLMLLLTPSVEWVAVTARLARLRIPGKGNPR